jgi:lipid-A-disaccharide synthase
MGPTDEGRGAPAFGPGDRLGAALMRALRQRSSEPLRFAGVGGREMAAAGLVSLLPLDDFAIIGFAAIPSRLPRIVSHMARVVRAVLARRPHRAGHH